MMQEKSQLYTPSVLQFSPSRLYFQHQNQILQKMWFISPMSIDIHFKYTFQEIQPTYFIEWGEFEWLTVDHDVHEQWIIYKIWLLNPKFQNIEYIALDFKNSYFDNPSVWPLVRWLLWWFIVFALLAWLSSKFQFGQVLLRLNLIWALILLAFYWRKIGKVLFKKAFKTRNLDYWGFAVNYTNQTDALMLSWEVLWVLKNWKRNIELLNLHILEIVYIYYKMFMTMNEIDYQNLQNCIRNKKRQIFSKGLWIIFIKLNFYLNLL